MKIEEFEKRFLGIDVTGLSKQEIKNMLIVMDRGFGKTVMKREVIKRLFDIYEKLNSEDEGKDECVCDE